MKLKEAIEIMEFKKANESKEWNDKVNKLIEYLKINFPNGCGELLYPHSKKAYVPTCNDCPLSSSNDDEYDGQICKFLRDCGNHET